MAEALLKPNTEFLTYEEREYLQALVQDLLGAASDAKAWITNGTATLQSAAAEARLGEDHGDGGGTVCDPAGDC